MRLGLKRSPNRPSRRPWAATIVVAGSAALSALYFAAWVWSAGYLPQASANLALALVSGFVAAALDSLKPDLMQAAGAHWQAKQRLASLGAGTLALLLALVSMWAIDGTLLKLRADGTGGAADTIATHTRTTERLEEAQAELVRLGAIRSIKEIAAAMGLVTIDVGVLRRTNHCAAGQITREDSRTACEPLMRLHEEMARASRREELERVAREASAWLDAHPRPAAADPQLEMWSKVAGASETQLGLAIAVLVGLALELVSLFGPSLLERRNPPVPVAPPPVITAPSVAAPLARRPVPAGRCLSEREALADLLQHLASGERPYVAECAARWQVNRGEASKRLSDWERQGLVGSLRQGKLKLILPV